MPFNPDQYLAKKTGGEQQKAGGFNPDTYLAKAAPQSTPQAPQEKPGILDRASSSIKDINPEAALQGFGQGAAMGYLPQLQAAAEPLTNKLFSALEGKPEPELPSYVERRDENIKALDETAKQSPGSFTTGLLGGAVTGAAAPGGLIGKAAPGLSAVKQAAVAGGVQGLLQNPGDTQGELSGPQLGERAQQAGFGALAGGASEKVLGGIAGAPQKLKEFAQEKAFKSSGAMLKDFRKAFARDRVNELGQSMIDNGLVKPGMTFDHVAEKATALKKVAGKQIGSIYDKLSDLASRAPEKLSDAFAIADPSTIAAELTAVTRSSKVMPKLNSQAYREQMDRYVESVASSGQLHDVRYLNDVIGELDSKINYAKRVPEMSDLQQGLLAMRQYLRNKVNDIADRVGATTGDRALSQQLKELNRQYGNMSEISRIAQDRTGREAANRLLSPSDYGTSAIGALIGSQFGETPEERLKHAVLGAGLGFANKGARKYGNPVLVQGANKLGAAAGKLAPLQENPAVVGAAASGIANQRRP